ncbi:hypothetical protein [Flavobacterium piscis]|uniref:Ribosomal protein S7 n=1 Tax=Flavobacterium piscis TaxID=1114874 RepID=A0ABU1YD23_9FLAO|nr:hypothetical protein [Flavobacterium piscis]MDR7211321.1 ribosomal protein S7 [Flavobacterium piscis]
MAPNIRKYIIYTIFLVSPLSLSLFAQNTIEKSKNSVEGNIIEQAFGNQNPITTIESVNHLGNSKQFIVGLSIPKGSFTIETAGIKNLISAVKEKSSDNIATYSALAKDIIENYKYDFSETFIDILFFEDIDLARIRTI